MVSTTGPEIIKVFLMLNSFIMLIIASESLKARQVFIFSILVSIISFYEQLKFHA